MYSYFKERKADSFSVLPDLDDVLPDFNGNNDDGGSGLGGGKGCDSGPGCCSKFLLLASWVF
mgnify:CR=1 FL=1